jgi:gas vesicle protein
MAERSSELEEETQLRSQRTNAVIRTTDTSDNVYIENRSTDDLTSSYTESTPDDEITDDTEQIREQIEETRSNLGDTISAIQEKLSFSNISEQVKDEVSDHINSAINTAKDSVYEATIGKVGTIMSYVDKGMNEISKTSAGRTASQNPVALSLIGLGLGMLLINGFSSKKRSTYRYESDYESDYDNDYDSDYDTADNYRGRNFSSRGGKSTFKTAQNKMGGVANSAYEGVSSAAGAVSGTVSDAAGAVSGTVSNVAGTVSETVGNVAGTVSDTVSSAASGAYKQVGNLGAKAKDVAGSAQEKYEYYMDENPLAVGAVALALGAAVGMAFPSTRTENRLMGETRENLLHKAEETARDAIGKVQQVAGEVSNTVKDADGDVTNTVKEGAEEVAKTAKDEAKKQGLPQ